MVKTTTYNSVPQNSLSTDRGQQTKDELGKPDKTTNKLFFTEVETLGFECGPMVLIKRNISSSALYGYSIWGESYWNEDYNPGFIIGDSSLGVLGTAKLGDINTNPFIHRVINPSNIHKEYYYDNIFCDTSATTATWSNTGTLTFSKDSEQVAQSTAVFMNEQTIYTVTLTCDADADALYEISADGGDNWQTISLNTQSIVQNQGQELLYRITNLQLTTGAGAFPTTFGTWGPTEYTKPDITWLNLGYTI